MNGEGCTARLGVQSPAVTSTEVVLTTPQEVLASSLPSRACRQAQLSLQPLAFQDPKLEAEYETYQRCQFLPTATHCAYFILLINIGTPVAKLAQLRALGWKTFLGSAIAAVSTAGYAWLLRSPPAWYGKYHVLLTVAFRIQSGIITVLLRGIYPEVLGQEPLSVLTYLRDFYHGGMNQFNLTVQSVGLPLPYWWHLAMQLLLAVYCMCFNGWLCDVKLAGPNLDATVPWLAQAVIRPVTLLTKGILGQPPMLMEYEEGAVASCLGATSFTQFSVGMLMAVWHVWREIKCRRRFLAQKAASAPHLRASFLSWPFGNAVGPPRCLVALLVPVLAFCALWQFVLGVIGLQQQADGLQVGPLGRAFLALPYGFF